MKRLVGRLCWAAALCAAVAAVGCTTHKQIFSEPEVLGGEEIDAETLNMGRTSYMLYCYACHGEEGDGKGPAAYAYWPPPRDFRKTSFKFAGVPEGDVPTDDELMRIVLDGLNGTAMLPWEIPEEDLWLALQYIKTFSPEKKGWRHPRKKPVAPTIAPDPFFVIPRVAVWDDDAFDEWITELGEAGEQVPGDAKGIEEFRKQKRAEAVAKQAEAIQKGAAQYHAGGCQLCHAAYVPPEQIVAWGGAPRATYPYDSDPKYSKTYEVVLVPPDFYRHPVRSAKQYWDADGNLRYDAVDFYRVIASGIPGTAMPSWAALPPEQVWAVAYYTASLSEQRYSPEAMQRRAELLALPPWTPPAPEPEPAPDVPAPAEGEPAQAEPAKPEPAEAQPETTP
jgi:mono/diheme cytochrome c family protein